MGKDQLINITNGCGGVCGAALTSDSLGVHTMTTDKATDTGTSESFLIAMLTGLTHQNIVQRIKHLCYDLEMSASEIKSMKHLYINDDDVPVVFYRLPSEFRHRLIESLPLEQVRTYTESITDLAELPEQDLEDIVSEGMESIINEPVAYEWQDGIKVAKVADGIDVFGDQVYSWKKC